MNPAPRVLVADDDPEFLGMISLRLAKLGYEVLEASDGDVALEVALQRRPDVIVLDIMMPKRNGWEVARELRGDERTRGMGIVVLTAIGEKVNEMTSPLYGADAYLDKPFEFAKLEGAIKQAIEAARKR